MADTSENAPLSQLITGLVGDVTGLVRKEVDLAKTEASEKFSKAMVGVEALLAGVILAIGAIGVLLSALVNGLAVVFLQWGMTEAAATSISAIVVGVVVAIVAWTSMSKGLKALRAENLALDRSAASLRHDAKVVKEKI